MSDIPSTIPSSLDGGAAASEQVRATADTLITKVITFTKELPDLYDENYPTLDCWHHNLNCLSAELGNIRLEMGDTKALSDKDISHWDSTRVIAVDRLWRSAETIDSLDCFEKCIKEDTERVTKELKKRNSREQLSEATTLRDASMLEQDKTERCELERLV